MESSNDLKPKFILDLNISEKKEFLNSFDYVFSDCDGVIWNIYKVIEKAGEGINCLKRSGKHFAYVSNNSVRQDSSYLKCFQDSGIEANINDVFHPLKNIIEYLKIIKFNGLIYCIATDYFKNSLKEAGYKVIDGPNKFLNETYSDLAKNIFDKEPVRAVIIDIDFNLTSPKLIKADLYLKNPECILIAGATDMKLPVGQGITILGPGPFIKIVEDSSGKKPIVLGKPGKDLGDFLMQRYNITDRKRVLFIGDMLDQDIAFGKQCGFQTLLVLSGGCKKIENLNHIIPDYFANSMSDFIDFYKDLD